MKRKTYKNPGISPWVVIGPLLLGVGVAGFFLIRKIVKGNKLPPPTLNQIINDILGGMPAGTKWSGFNQENPPSGATPAGFRYASVITEKGKLWFLIPTVTTAVLPPTATQPTEASEVAQIRIDKNLSAAAIYKTRVLLPNMTAPFSVSAPTSGKIVKSYARGNYNYWFWVPGGGSA